jgi:hypothetical protein
MHATTVAVDLAKTVFELARANAQWHIVARQDASDSGTLTPLESSPPFLGAHYLYV